MGIQYLLEHPCRPKTELGVEHLLNLVKTARSVAPKKGVAVVETAVVLSVPTELGGAAGMDEAVRKDLTTLEYYVSECLSCPANVASEGSGGGIESAFGCYYELPYPITGYLEDILLHAAFAAFEDPGNNPGLKLVTGMLKAYPKGRNTPAARVRKMGKEFFERKAPKETKLELGGHKVVVDSNHIATILMAGPVPPQAGLAYATLLTRGVERAKTHGVGDPRVAGPLLKVAAMAKAASKLGNPLKIEY
jgi:hypothetical protein